MSPLLTQRHMLLRRATVLCTLFRRTMSSVPTPGNPADFWNSRFAEEGFAYGTGPNAFVAAEHGRIEAGSRVVDLGCGEGRNGVFLASKGYTVTAVDFSASGIEKTRQLATQVGVELASTHVADATSWAPEAPLDAVVSVFLHVPPPQKRALFSNISQMLRPGGLLVAEWYSPDQVLKDYKTGGPPVAAACVSKEEVVAALGSEGTFELLDETEYEVHEGKYHNGMGAVIRVVWRKAAPDAASV